MRNATKRVQASVVLAALIFAVMPAAPAAAGIALVSLRGTAWLSTPDSGCFVGTAAGVAGGPVNGRATATWSGNTVNPTAGNGTGTLSLPGHANIPFTSVRMGAIAVLTLGATAGHAIGGAAIAGFAPLGNPLSEPSCGVGVPAQVVGVAAYS